MIGLVSRTTESDCASICRPPSGQPITISLEVAASGRDRGIGELKYVCPSTTDTRHTDDSHSSDVWSVLLITSAAFVAYEYVTYSAADGAHVKILGRPSRRIARGAGV